MSSLRRGRVAGIGEHPLEWRPHDDGLGLVAVRRRVRVVDRRDLERVAGHVDRGVQLTRKAGERLGGHHRLPQRLELLEGLVGALGPLLGAALT